MSFFGDEFFGDEFFGDELSGDELSGDEVYCIPFLFNLFSKNCKIVLKTDPFSATADFLENTGQQKILIEK